MAEITVNRLNKQQGQSNLLAFADVTIDGIKINGIRLVSGSQGNFVSMPQKPSKKLDGKYFPIVWIDSQDLRQKILDAVQEAYDKTLA